MGTFVIFQIIAHIHNCLLMVSLLNFPSKGFSSDLAQVFLRRLLIVLAVIL